MSTDDIEKKAITASKPEKRVHKYTVEEVLQSLYYQCCDADDEYDGFLHIISDLNGMEIKLPVKDIVHEAAKYQHKS